MGCDEQALLGSDDLTANIKDDVYLITGRLQVIRELDHEDFASRIWDGQVGAVDKVAFRRNIARRVRVRGVPDHQAVEQQP